MRYYSFKAAEGFTYHWSGKFVSPNNEWVHMTRDLIDYEMIVVTEGVLYIASERHEYTVTPGQYLIMEPTIFQHGTRKTGCSFYWLHFGYNQEKNNHKVLKSKNENSDIVKYNPENILIPQQGELASLERMIILMKQLQDSDKRYREENLNRYLCSAILAETAVQSKIYREYGDKNSKEQLYNDIVDYIGWHISENIRISEIAEYFGYNEKYLTTFFKGIAGISIKKYVIQTKMEHAKSALAETNQPVSQIAYGLGYSDAHNFTNAFKKEMGINPTEYRNGYSKRNLYDR